MSLFHFVYALTETCSFFIQTPKWNTRLEVPIVQIIEGLIVQRALPMCASFWRGVEGAQPPPSHVPHWFM